MFLFLITIIKIGGFMTNSMPENLTRLPSPDTVSGEFRILSSSDKRNESIEQKKSSSWAWLYNIFGMIQKPGIKVTENKPFFSSTIKYLTSDNKPFYLNRISAIKFLEENLTKEEYSEIKFSMTDNEIRNALSKYYSQKVNLITDSVAAKIIRKDLLEKIPEEDERVILNEELTELQQKKIASSLRRHKNCYNFAVTTNVPQETSERWRGNFYRKYSGYLKKLNETPVLNTFQKVNKAVLDEFYNTPAVKQSIQAMITKSIDEDPNFLQKFPELAEIVGLEYSEESGQLTITIEPPSKTGELVIEQSPLKSNEFTPAQQEELSILKRNQEKYSTLKYALEANQYISNEDILPFMDDLNTMKTPYLTDCTNYLNLVNQQKNRILTPFEAAKKEILEKIYDIRFVSRLISLSLKSERSELLKEFPLIAHELQKEYRKKAEDLGYIS